MKKHPGAHLVSVHSSKQNDYLLCIVKKFNPDNLRIWLGGFELFKVKILFVSFTNRGSEENELSCFSTLFFNDMNPLQFLTTQTPFLSVFFF